MNKREGEIGRETEREGEGEREGDIVESSMVAVMT